MIIVYLELASSPSRAAIAAKRKCWDWHVGCWRRWGGFDGGLWGGGTGRVLSACLQRHMLLKAMQHACNTEFRVNISACIQLGQVIAN